MKRIQIPLPWWCVVPVMIAMSSLLGSMAVWAWARSGGNDPVEIVFADGGSGRVPAREEFGGVGWMAPIERSGRGRELFTPANFVYDAETNRYRPPVPSHEATRLRPDLSSELDVLGVRAEPYPVQLVGHVGAGVGLRGIFEIVASGESAVARAGHTFAGLGLTVESVQVRRAPASSAAGPEGSRRFAIAVLRDALSGERIELAATERRLLAPPVAYARLPDDERTFELREGVRFEVRGRTYRVRALHLAPPGVEVEDETGERWLVPARPERTSP